MKTIKFVHIGRKFYRESGTMMGSIYKLQDGLLYRSDWGKIQLLLEQGNSIKIRPATKTELSQFDKELANLKNN